MPRMDGTGPSGQGPMTGGGFGQCTENTSPMRTIGRGFARGRRRGNRYSAVSNNRATAKPVFSVFTANDETSANENFADLEIDLKRMQKQNEILLQENETLKSAANKKQQKKAKGINDNA